MEFIDHFYTTLPLRPPKTTITKRSKFGENSTDLLLPVILYAEKISSKGKQRLLRGVEEGDCWRPILE